MRWSCRTWLTSWTGCQTARARSRSRPAGWRSARSTRASAFDEHRDEQRGDQHHEHPTRRLAAGDEVVLLLAGRAEVVLVVVRTGRLAVALVGAVVERRGHPGGTGAGGRVAAVATAVAVAPTPAGPPVGPGDPSGDGPAV